MGWYVTHPPGLEDSAAKYACLEGLVDFELVCREDCPPRHIYITSVPIEEHVVFPASGRLPYGHESWQRN